MINYQMPTHSTRLTRYSAISLFILLLPASSTFANDIKKESILAGKNIYMHGKLSSGKDIIATTVGDVQLTGEQAACVNCHRHSGLGSIEGSTIAPAITGEILFSEQKIKAHRYQPSTKQNPIHSYRPAYTKDSLKEHITIRCRYKRLSTRIINAPIYLC